MNAFSELSLPVLFFLVIKMFPAKPGDTFQNYFSDAQIPISKPSVGKDVK